MKKIIFAILSLFSSHALQALPIGNPVEPALLNHGIWLNDEACDCNTRFSTLFNKWSFGIGYSGDFVFNRNLQVRNGQGLDQGRVIQETTLTTNAGYLFLNFCDVVEVFSALGTSKLRIRTREASWFLAGTHAGSLQPETHFSWSAGARAIVFSWRCFSLGIEGQYFRTRPHLTKYFSESFIRLTTYIEDAPQTTYSEWQAGGGLSYTLKLPNPNFGVIPYIGFKWSRVSYTTHNFTFVDRFSNTLTIFDLSNHKHYGFAVGTTFTFCDQIGVTVEGRFADERAVYINGQICF